MNAPITTDNGECDACAGEGFDYVLHGCRQDVVRCEACHGSGVKLAVCGTCSDNGPACTCNACHGSGVKLAVCGTCSDNGPACTCNAPGGYCDCAPCRECGGVS
jgi:hypothetical protein